MNALQQNVPPSQTPIPPQPGIPNSPVPSSNKPKKIQKFLLILVVLFFLVISTKIAYDLSTKSTSLKPNFSQPQPSTIENQPGTTNDTNTLRSRPEPVDIENKLVSTAGQPADATKVNNFVQKLSALGESLFKAEYKIEVGGRVKERPTQNEGGTYLVLEDVSDPNKAVTVQFTSEEIQKITVIAVDNNGNSVALGLNEIKEDDLVNITYVENLLPGQDSGYITVVVETRT